MNLNISSNKILVFISLFLTSTYTFAQYNCKLVWDANFSNTETIVVASDFSISALEKIFKENWKLTPYKIVKKEDVEKNFQQYVDNPKYTFITSSLENSTKVIGSSSQTLFFTQRIKNNGNAVLRTIISAGITESTDHLYLEEAEIKKDLITIQQFATISKEDHQKLMTPDPSIKDKTLLIAGSTLNEKAIEQIKKTYPYKFKILNKEELSKEILNPSPKTVLFETVYYPSGYVTVIDLNTNKMVHIISAKGYGNYYYVNILRLGKQLE